MDVLGDGEYSEIGMYTQFCPSFRELIDKQKLKLFLAPVPEVLETLQALCLPLGTSYERQRHEHSAIQAHKRAKTEGAAELFAKLPLFVQQQFNEVDRCEEDKDVQDHSSSNNN